MIRDPYMKGLTPMGVFRKIDIAHRKWCAKIDLRMARLSSCVLVPSGEIANRDSANAASRVSELDSDEEELSDSDDEADYDSDGPVDEDKFDENGVKVPDLVKPLRPPQ